MGPSSGGGPRGEPAQRRAPHRGWQSRATLGLTQPTSSAFATNTGNALVRPVHLGFDLRRALAVDRAVEYLDDGGRAVVWVDDRLAFRGPPVVRPSLCARRRAPPLPNLSTGRTTVRPLSRRGLQRAESAEESVHRRVAAVLTSLKDPAHPPRRPPEMGDGRLEARPARGWRIGLASSPPMDIRAGRPRIGRPGSLCGQAPRAASCVLAVRSDARREPGGGRLRGILCSSPVSPAGRCSDARGRTDRRRDIEPFGID